MEADLETTNLLLGIMAAVSVLQAVMLIGTGVVVFLVYKRVMRLANSVEERHVAPAMLRVHAILDDVKGVTATVKEETQRVDQAIQKTIGRVDDTVGRLRGNVRATAIRVVGLMRGLRAVIETLHSESRRDPGAGAGRRVM